jgi:hypothetical protein
MIGAGCRQQVLGYLEVPFIFGVGGVMYLAESTCVISIAELSVHRYKLVRHWSIDVQPCVLCMPDTNPNAIIMFTPAKGRVQRRSFSI